MTTISISFGDQVEKVPYDGNYQKFMHQVENIFSQFSRDSWKLAYQDDDSNLTEIWNQGDFQVMLKEKQEPISLFLALESNINEQGQKQKQQQKEQDENKIHEQQDSNQQQINSKQDNQSVNSQQREQQEKSNNDDEEMQSDEESDQSGQIKTPIQANKETAYIKTANMQNARKFLLLNDRDEQNNENISETRNQKDFDELELGIVKLQQNKNKIKSGLNNQVTEQIRYKPQAASNQVDNVIDLTQSRHNYLETSKMKHFDQLQFLVVRQNNNKRNGLSNQGQVQTPQQKIKSTQKLNTKDKSQFHQLQGCYVNLPKSKFQNKNGISKQTRSFIPQQLVNKKQQSDKKKENTFQQGAGNVNQNGLKSINANMDDVQHCQSASITLPTTQWNSIQSNFELLIQQVSNLSKQMSYLEQSVLTLSNSHQSPINFNARSNNMPDLRINQRSNPESEIKYCKSCKAVAEVVYLQAIYLCHNCQNNFSINCKARPVNRSTFQGNFPLI